MKVITAPQSYAHRPERISLFLAGGITNCPDWQSEAIDRFKGMAQLDILNPRRPFYPMENADEARIQISWEFHQLEQSDIILFWFPKESICPIVLYELGVQMGKAMTGMMPKSFVGTHPEYARKTDVKIQTQLALKRAFRIYEDLETMVNAAKLYVTTAQEAMRTHVS